MRRVTVAPRPLAVLIGVIAIGAMALQGDAPPPVASHIKHAPIQVRRNADGSLKRGPHFEMLSANWAGYAVADFETGQTYTSAQATWTVPTVIFEAGAPTGNATQYSAMWVGIGGFCEDVLCNPDPTLIQLGTAHDVASDGTTLYYSWYEAFPSAAVIMDIMDNPVSPGDVVTALVQCTASCSSKKLQTWTLTMSSSAGWQWSVPVPYNSPKLSAEWIVEAPLAFGLPLPLADFTTMNVMDPDTGNESKPPLSLANNGIIMVDVVEIQGHFFGQVAVPSDADALGFNVCWGAFPEVPACSPP